MNTWYSAVVEAERTAFRAVALPLWAQGHVSRLAHPVPYTQPSCWFQVILFLLLFFLFEIVAYLSD